MIDSTERKVALITGGAAGIGAAIAARLVGEGWRVVLADIDANALQHRVAALGQAARATVADIGEETDVLRVLNEIREREDRLDALVCNAGIMIRKPIADLTLDEWSRVLATNLTSTFLLARAAEDLLRARHGAIVTIASTRAHQSEPHTEAYAASKGGLVALTHALAMSLGPDVRVNSVSPGWIHTHAEVLRPEDHAQHPAGRVGQPEDVDALVSWLLGPESRFVTGAEFIIDGGMTRKMIYTP
jgi:NAD(P)-dependent dehydrogenase (short-subunit alcohol dehydrogenase family)